MEARTFMSVAILSFLLQNVWAAASSTGFTVSVFDVSYFLPPKSVAAISIAEDLKAAFSTNGPFVPFTVVKSTENNAAEISSVIASYLVRDDVFQTGFLEAIYVQRSGNGTLGASQVQVGNISSTVLTGAITAGTLNSGPYFLNAFGQVYEAWRLYPDTNGAFTESVIADPAGKFTVLPAGIQGQNIAIAVPSRLYFTKTVEKPLAGVRLGIKDIYDIKGLRTSNGNRAWYWLYPPADSTATPVQNLIDAGGIVVGKMITSQFANGETATADWVDYHEAFNPRGDGYQDTSSSSSGGGAGAAAYPWLDVNLGSDSGGSVRGPAQVQGIYGNRPSHGLVTLEHTMPLSPVLDTAGLLSRDPLLWKDAAKAMYRSNLTFSNAYPASIATLEWPTESDNIANTLLIDFLSSLKTFLNANATAFNISAEWTTDNPTLDPIEEFLNITYPILITKQQIPLVRDPFYRDYAAKHDGRRPFVDPVPLLRWGWSQNSSYTVADAITNKTAFMSWINGTVLAPSATTCSESLLLYVGSAGKDSTTYRNLYRSAPTPPWGFGDGSVSILSETPDFVVPIGEAPYESTITGHTEYLPVTVDLMAAKGCDGMLFQLIEDLYEAGILKIAKAGQSGMTGGDVLFRRERQD